MVKYIYLILVVLFIVPSCVPKALLLDQHKLVSMYFDRKIKNLESIPNPIKDDKRQLIKTKVEYGFGVIMEQSDRLIEKDYTAGLSGYKTVIHLSLFNFLSSILASIAFFIFVLSKLRKILPSI